MFSAFLIRSIAVSTGVAKSLAGLPCEASSHLRAGRRVYSRMNPLSLSLRQGEWARSQGGRQARGPVISGKTTEDIQNGH